MSAFFISCFILTAKQNLSYQILSQEMEEGVDLWKGEMATVLFKHLQVKNFKNISSE